MVEVQDIPCNLCQARDSEKLYEKGGLEIARCHQCGLVYANPRLTQAEIWKRYSPTYFWDEYMPAHRSPKGEFDAAWHRQRSQPVLDLLRPYQSHCRCSLTPPPSQSIYFFERNGINGLLYDSLLNLN